ncbi:hypothetical protein DFAR_1150025 [Desulfarculales bacterium]
MTPVWKRGHSFVPAYFNEASTEIWLRCFLCPDCRAVIRLQPWGYWSRLQAPVETIRLSLSNKLARGRWDPGLPRFRQRHWLKGLLRQVSLYLGSSWSGALLGAFNWLSGRGQPVGAKRKPFPSLSHLPKGAVVLARPPVYTWAKHPHGGPTWTRTKKTSNHLPFRRH